MTKDEAKKLLEQFEFAKLFVEELGWDRHKADLPVAISGTTFALRAVAEKRGMVAWVCQAPAGQQIPDRAMRKRIEHQVAKTTLEHLTIFIDTKRVEQIWCWARRESGKPASVLEHFWYASSGNRGFLQKLGAIAFSLAEEDSLTLVDVTARARAAFDRPTSQLLSATHPNSRSGGHGNEETISCNISTRTNQRYRLSGSPV